MSNTYAAANATNNLAGLVTETETVAVPCAGFTQREIPSVPFSFNSLSAPASVSRPAQVVTKSRMYYDDHNWSDAFPQSAAPAKGLVTMVKQAADYSGGAYTYQTTKRNHYDKYGRVDDTYDGNGSVTHTAFTENTIGLTTGVKVSNAVGHSTSTTVSPRRGLTLSSSDINDVKTTVQYDALGRTTSVWLNDRAVTTPANFKFSYTISNTGISGTTTDRLTESLGYTRAVTLNDALLRPRQTQSMTPQGGRLVTDTFYDTRGWVSATYDGWWDPGTTPAIGAPVSVHDLKLKAPSQTFLKYDGLGRVAVTERAKDGVTVSKSISVYGGDRTTVVPPTGGTVTTTLVDPIGRTTALQEYTVRPVVTTPADIFTGTFTTTGGSALTTTYSYDAQGNQNKVTDTKQNNWISQYNLLGQMTNRKDPDAGETKNFRYDNNGNLLQSTDGRGKTTSFTYDDINRRTGSFAATVENQAAANQLSSIVYDNTNNAVSGMTYPKGHVTTSVAYASGQPYKTQMTGFTVFGSSKGEKVTIPGTDALSGDWNFSRTYYPNTGLLFKDTYPARGGLPSETVINTYDTFDQLEALAGLNPYLQAVTQDAYSRISQTVLGSSTNQTSVTNTWDEHNGRLKQRLVSRKPTSPANVDQQSYEYDLAGNLIKQISQRPAANNVGETQCFTYDQLRRLSEAWTATDNCATAPTATSRAMVGNTIGGASAYWTSWAFDELGNRTSQIQRSLTGGADTTTSYKYDENGAQQPHTLTSTSTTGGSTSSTSYKYDAAGNMTTRNAANGNQTLTWDDAGKLGSVTNASGTSTSIYNVDGSLLLQRDPGSATLYLAGQQHVLNTSTGLVAGTRYYPLPGTGAAVRTGSGANYSFAVSDTRGTPSLYLNNTAQTPSWRLFTPYGTPRGATIPIPDNRGFLNKPENKTTGLTSVGAREYDPAIGRFISVDPVQDMSDPQQWNGYSYANNNPTTLSDPTGLRPWEPDLDDKFGNPLPTGKGGGSKGGGNGKPQCDLNCVLDSPAPDNGVGHWARVDRGYDGTEAYTYRDALEFASQSQSGYMLVCIHTFGYSEESCDSSDPWSKPKPGQLRWDDLKTLGGLAIVIGLVAGGIACVETVIVCGAAAADGAMGEAAFGSAVFGTPAGAAVTGGAAAGGRWLSKFLGVGKTGAKISPAAEGLLLGKCSFTPDTEVLMADGSTKPIKDVKVGDKVLATDPDTGETAGKHVTALHSHVDSDLVDVVVVDAKGVRSIVHATGNHPFWDATTQTWTRADQLRNGAELRSSDGTPAYVGAVRSLPGRGRMLNLTVAHLHTYHVLAGAAPVLVHNCGGDLTAMAATGERTGKGGTSYAGNEYKKHMMRGELPAVSQKPDSLRVAGREMLEEILTDPRSSIEPLGPKTNFPGGYGVVSNTISPNGQGFVTAVFDADHTFQYFAVFN